MDLAVTGMHYTGMAAAMFVSDAFCSLANALQEAWVILGLALTATAVASLSQWSALWR